MKLSIAMIVKNEERNLNKTLSALQVLKGKLEYEIVIVDTGSNDSTVDIAKKFTDKIYFHKWENDFAKMRNISMEYCKGEWILVLDADEVLENAEELINFFNRKDLDKYKSAIVGIDNDLDGEYVYCKIIRLFKRKEKIKYEGIVHEQPVNCKPVLNTSIRFLHNGYSREDYEVMIYKFERNKELLINQLEGLDGVDKIYPLYQLGNTYSMAGMSKEAFEIMREAYDLTISRKDGGVNTYVIHSYAQLLFERKMYKEVIKVCKKGLKYSKNLDYYYMIAISSTEVKDYSIAAKYYDEYLSRRERFSEEEIEDVTLIEWSYNKKKYLVGQQAFNCYLNDDYDSFTKIFLNIEDKKIKDKLEEIYIYCSIKKAEYSNLCDYYKDREIEDNDVEKIINSILRVQQEDGIDTNVLIKEFSNLDNRVRIYIEKILCREKMDDEVLNIEYRGFFNWKSQIMKRYISDCDVNVDSIKDLDVEDMERYIAEVATDYKGIKKLYEYSESKFLSRDIKELCLVTSIEKILMCNESIEKDKYESLCFRTLINKLNLIELMYSKEILNNPSIINVLNQYDRLILNINDLINNYSINKVQYIKGLKTILKEMPYYKKMIKVLLDKVNENPVNNEMILEKERLCVIIERYLNEGLINEAKEILDALNGLFVFDYKLLNYEGVISYMEGQKNNAILKFALSNKLKKDSFDSVYNIACLLESMDRVKEARYYFEESYRLCNDELMKRDIKNVIESI